MVGASGAVYGILLAYGMMFPDAVILIGLILPMKAKYAVVLFGLIELLSTASGGGGGVAHLAHLGGMASGFLFLRLTIGSLRAGTGLRNPWRNWRGRRRVRVVRPAARDAGPRPFEARGGDARPAGAGRQGAGPSGVDRSEVDAILDKISREGLQSLTPQEQDTLRRAGRR